LNLIIKIEEYHLDRIENLTYKAGIGLIDFTTTKYKHFLNHRTLVNIRI